MMSEIETSYKKFWNLVVHIQKYAHKINRILFLIASRLRNFSEFCWNFYEPKEDNHKNLQNQTQNVIMDVELTNFKWDTNYCFEMNCE